HGLGHVHQFVVFQLSDLVGEGRVFEDGLELAANDFFARILLQELADPLAKLISGPAQVCFQDLSYVHTAGNAQGVQDDLNRSAIGQVRHVLFRQNAGDYTLVTMPASHLVAYAELALHGDVNLDQLDNAGRQFITLLQLGDFLVGDLAQDIDLARGHLLDFVNLLVDARVFVGIFDALQIARRDTLDRLAVKNDAFGQQPLVGAFIMQVGLDLLVSEDRFQALQTFVGKNSDFIGKVLFQPLDLSGLNGFGALVL